MKPAASRARLVAMNNPRGSIALPASSRRPAQARLDARDSQDGQATITSIKAAERRAVAETAIENWLQSAVESGLADIRGASDAPDSEAGRDNTPHVEAIETRCP
jgi:hypothetical protein